MINFIIDFFWGNRRVSKNKISSVIEKSSSDSGHNYIKTIDWYDDNKKKWITKKITHQEFEEISSKSVARWCIKQFVTCPYCNWETDIIAANLRNKSSQGKMNAKDIGVFQRSDGSSYARIQDKVVDIPAPPYFGAAWEDTDGLDEHIACDGCGHDLSVEEVHWQYGE